MFNVRWWTWRRILLGQWCISKRRRVIVRLSPLWEKKKKKKRTWGSPLNRFSPEWWRLNPIPGWTDAVRVVGGGMNTETVDHGILRRIIIASSARRGIIISCSHPRDRSVRVGRGQVKREIKAGATGISLETSARLIRKRVKSSGRY